MKLMQKWENCQHAIILDDHIRFFFLSFLANANTQHPPSPFSLTHAGTGWDRYLQGNSRDSTTRVLGRFFLFVKDQNVVENVAKGGVIAWRWRK
jgi:hypothetical protein